MASDLQYTIFNHVWRFFISKSCASYFAWSLITSPSMQRNFQEAVYTIGDYLINIILPINYQRLVYKERSGI